MDGKTTPTQLREVELAAVVFGNEHNGVSAALRVLADDTYAIPMAGFVESLNVSVAAAITMHAVTHDRPGDLSSDDQAQLTARFMLESVRAADDVVIEMLARTGMHP
jgi:tRNA (guanosine-2'-O-)-methyltransferase